MKEGTVLVRGEVFNHPVELPLTQNELIAYADELTTLDTLKRETESRHQAEKGRFKADMERVQERATVGMDKLRTKREFKQVECYNDFNFFEGTCDIRRVDTNEVVKTRKMTADEFREKLPFDESEADEPETAAAIEDIDTDPNPFDVAEGESQVIDEGNTDDEESDTDA